MKTKEQLKKFIQRKKEEIYNLYQDGLTAEQIAIKIDMPISWVNHCIKTYNIPLILKILSESKKINSDTFRKTKVGIIVETIQNILLRYGISFKEVRSKSKEDRLVFVRRRIAIALKKEGVSAVKIGRLLGRDHSTILYYFKVIHR